MSDGTSEGCRKGHIMNGTRVSAIAVVLSLGLRLAPAFAQAPLPAPPPPPQTAPAPAYPAAELDRIVSPIALYPDPLLAQVLAASTFPQDIPDAARWADEHHNLPGPQLTAAITEDRLPWDPSVQALLPFPSVLEMMAGAMPWTQELGDAFLAQRGDVMDAVQRQRQNAQRYGYLKSNAQVTVSSGPYIEILPIDPGFMCVPYYDPYLVFGPPPAGVLVGGAFGCGFGVRIGAWFGPWGWGTTHFVWGTHVVIINNAPWGRIWGNRGTYVHPYPGMPRHPAPRLPDRHVPIPRTPAERGAPRAGRMPTETHDGGRGSGGARK
jgi:Protein of unknown function (DUF3300)